MSTVQQKRILPRPASQTGLLLAALTLCTAVVGAPHARAAVLSPTWTATPGGSVDGLAVGDVDADGRGEIAVLTRGGAYDSTQAVTGVGSLTLITDDGVVLWQQQPGKELAGYPAVGDFDGDGFDEFAVCEADIAGRCTAYDGDGTLLFQSPIYWYPGMTNGGPAVADVNGDGFADLVVASFGADVALLMGPMGTEVWRRDLWLDNGELLFGHPTVDDLDRDGDLEIVLGGWYAGGIYVLDATTGTTLRLTVPSTLPANPIPSNVLYFQSSGPLIAELDGDPEREIVALMVGSAATAVVGLEHDLSVNWWQTLTGTFGYTSPIATDLDRDGDADIVVAESGGTLYVLAGSNGTVTLSGTIGSGLWSTPGVVDASGDGTPDLMALSTSDLRIYDIRNSSTLVHSYSNPGAGALYPPPVAADLDSDGRLELLTGAWMPQQFFKFDLPDGIGFAWTSYMGNERRTGFLDAGDVGALLGNDPANALYIVREHTLDLLPSGSSTCNSRLNQAANRIREAWRRYALGRPHQATTQLRQAISDLVACGAAADTTIVQRETAWTALLLLRQYIDRTASIFDESTAEIVAAENAYTAAESEYNAGNYFNAASLVENAAIALRNWLDNSSSASAIFNNCPTPPSHVFHRAECDLALALDETIAAGITDPDVDLDNAELNLRRALHWTPDIVYGNAFGWMIRAENDLERVGSTNMSATQARIAEAGRTAVRQLIDDVIVWRGSSNSNVVNAEALYAQGLAAQAAGDWGLALMRFRDAWNTVDNAI